MAKKSKVESAKNVEFAKGGDTPMFGPQAAGPEKPGVTAHDVTGGAPGPQYAAGGSGKMFGYTPSLPAKAGITSAR